MRYLFCLLAIINFANQAMAQKQLSFDEANQLCIEALILLTHQSLQQKRRKSSLSLSSPATSSKRLYDSPQKIFSTETKIEHPQSSIPQFQLDSYKNHTPHNHQIHRKNSLKKKTSFHDLCQLPEEVQLKNIQNEGFQLLPCLIEEPPRIQKHKILNISGLQTSGKLSQMSVEPQPQLYDEDHLKELKRDLEIKSKGKICKTQEINEVTGQMVGYHLYCKNDPQCPFHYFLGKTSKLSAKGNNVYVLISDHQEHLKDCLEEQQELTFMKLTKVIDSMELPIMRLLAQKGELKPKDILSWMANQLGHADYRFIYDGLSCKNYQKAAKKYFDNLIYKIKNPLGF